METGHDANTLIVGARQSLKALHKNIVTEVYIAKDADESITGEFKEKCIFAGIKIVQYRTMVELGKDCGIEIGAAVACRIEK